MGNNYSKYEILKNANELVGKTFREIVCNNYQINNKDKGNLGNLIQVCHFGIERNNDEEPDFKEAGVELKVTPYKKLKRKSNGSYYSAKERLVLNVIDYHKEVRYEFENSSFWRKNQSLLLIFYLFVEDLSREDFRITHTCLYEYPEEDLKIIKSDWEKIVNMIKEGKAHEISESSTLYLAACTKGASSSQTRSQPFSPIPAKQRAFSFKTTYMNYVLRNYILGEKEDEKIISDPKLLENTTFEDYIIHKVQPYYGKTVNELKEHFNIKSNAKSINYLLLARILGINGNISNTAEFKKANIVPKTVVVEHDGRIIESMSFKTFKYTEIVNETWETSELKEYFETTKFMFVVFSKDETGVKRFSKVVFWNMPANDIDRLEHVWKKTVDVIQTGNIVKSISESGKRRTNFPGKKEHEIMHVRPHAANANDVYPLPVPDKLTKATEYTKHCFWLNNDYVYKQITEY